MISLRAVSKNYADGFTAVEDLSLEIEEGEIVVLLGASGCGKTTTLKMINQLIVHTKGQIVVDGQDVTSIDPVSLRRRIGYVFQGIGLFPHHSVAANIAAIPRLLGWSREQIDARVDELLELVGLPCEQFRDRQPAALSGGQQQRVGVARALAAKSSILLMDEPFGALDPVTRDTLQRELLAMRDRLGLTILLVTHDVTEAVLLADRVAVMDAGRLVQVDTPGRLFHAPANDAVASLLATPRRQADLLHRLLHFDESSAGGSDTR
jgi:osmoprotectant transport system ATP-binding protein